MKSFYILLLILLTALPALAAPTNTSGPWGIDAAGFRNFSTALASPATIGKTIVVTKPVTVNDMTVTGNRQVKVMPGGRIDVAAGKTLAFALDSGFEAGGHAAFGGAGAVTGLKYAEPEWFGAITGDAGDDGSAIQKALNAATTVRCRPGVYLCTIVRLNSYNELYGAGSSTVLRAFDSTTASQYVLATNAYGEGTEDPAENKHDIYVHDLKLDGRVAEYGYQPFYYTLNINATTNMLVERVEMYGFRGDGVYLGSGNYAGLIRRNQNLTFRDCTIDGVTKTNRSGMSVIDCDVLTVENCRFKNIGNPELSSSVGGFNCEPNGTNAIYRTIRLVGCTFSDIDTTNTYGVSFFTGGRQLDRNDRDWSVENCTFIRCYKGVSVATAAKTPGSEHDYLRVVGCKFYNSVTEDINLASTFGVTISDCHFEVFPIGSTSYRGGISVGASYGNAIDTVIESNTFKGLRPQFGCIAIRGARSLLIEKNNFYDITGPCVQIVTTDTVGLARSLEGIIVQGNVAYDFFDTIDGSSATTGMFVNTSGIGSEFISSTCIERDNLVFGGIFKHRATSLVTFREQKVTAAPSNGTWDVGNSVTLAAAYGGTYTCTAAGTYGTLTGVTANATNGSYALTGVVDTSTVLREGHWITVDAASTAYKIAKIDGSTVYIATAFAGTTGTSLAVAFAPPSFAYSAPVSRSADRGNESVTLTLGVSPMVNTWATPLTADRAVSLNNTNAVAGARFRIVRAASATGAYNLNVGGGLKLLAAGQWCEVEYDGTTWVVTASGSL